MMNEIIEIREKLKKTYQNFDSVALEAAMTDDYTEHQTLKRVKLACGEEIRKIELHLVTNGRIDIVEQVREEILHERNKNA